jgi:N6-adenosine-specific RNA methylase IME4
MNAVDRTVTAVEIHEAANAFPIMASERLKELAEDIRANGLREPIRLLNGKVIDGRNRLKACQMVDAKPRFETIANDVNPWAFVWSLNGQRRDLTADQRYIIWKECAEANAAWKDEHQRLRDNANEARSAAAKARSRNTDGTLASGATTCGTTGGPTRTTDKKAKASGTDRGTVERNEWLAKHRPDLHRQVKDGELTSSKAYSIAKNEKRKEEIARQREAIESGEANLPKGKFEVVVMDPPWNYGSNYSSECWRSACPYPEMTQPQLLDLNPPFADDAVLFLWTTHQFKWDAKALLLHWGFEYKAELVWDKEKMGMGRWLRLQCEFCLIGVRGKPVWENTTWRDIIREPRREHSRKPETFYRMVEQITVGRRLDYFSRGERQGWEAFGNDTAKF